MKIRLLIIFTVFAVISLYAQEDNTIHVIGDSLVGKVIDGESIREVHGNVVMTQGKVRITCKKAIQYIEKNEAELFDDVVVTQDSIIINTDKGYYYGNSKIAFSKSGVTFYDGHVHLKSVFGYYYFDEKKAYFYQNVKLNDSVSTLTSDTLTYYDNEDKAVGIGNVNVRDTSSIIFADSLINFRNEGINYGYGHVKILDPKNELIISGRSFENHRSQNYSKIFGDPFLIKIDTSDDGKVDTLTISSKLMEAYSDSTNRLIATDSVKIVRGTFASINNYTVYYRRTNHLFTYRMDGDIRPPVLWNENAQLMGDTVNIYTENNRIQKMFINSNASIFTNNPDFNLRYDQVSGKNIEMLFGKNGLELTDVKGNVLSIYYLYDKGNTNGLMKSSSAEAKIYFADGQVSNVRFYGNPVSEYHPENLIEGKEIDFTLPTFIIMKNKPVKEILLQNKYDLFKLLEENRIDYGK